LDLVVLVIALAIILLGAELFTNGIEWFGRKLQLAEGAVGSVLAAVGTALPETMIPIIAILGALGASSAEASEASHHIGVGAILGAPFMLSTLAMFVTGVAVLVVARRREKGDEMIVNTHVLGHDMRYFAIAYAIAIGAAFLPVEPVWLKWIVAVVLIGIYAWYVKAHFNVEAEEGEAEDLPPLRFHRFDRSAHVADPASPRLRIVNLQVLAALGMIILGAVFFVDAVENISGALGVDEALLALVIAPIATELPEKFNSIIWVRQGKDTLAMGNITGAMVFQSTIPTVVALLFAADAWRITEDSMIAFASAGIAFLSSAAIFLPMIRRGRLNGRGLLIGGVFYLAYLGLVVAGITGLIGGVAH
jgi:cation:H+ antiporter